MPIILGPIILTTAPFFVPAAGIEHPSRMGRAPGADCICTFSLFGFIIGLWAKGSRTSSSSRCPSSRRSPSQAGRFYSIDMPPGAWRTFSLFNPVVYIISGFRWCFYGRSDVPFEMSPSPQCSASSWHCLAVVAWIFKTGYRLKN